ncbi:MAG TPA: hypothetical protein DCZ76_03680 [Treponema sp.]|nr:hypothetical protein [Treponema sp.]
MAQVPEHRRRAGAISNGGGRGPRNPERAVTKGLSGRISQGMNGRTGKSTVQKEIIKQKTVSL